MRLIPLIAPQGFGEFDSLLGSQIGLHHESRSVIGGNRFKEACEVQAHCLLGIQGVQGALGKKSRAQNIRRIGTQLEKCVVGALFGKALPKAPHRPGIIGIQSRIENERFFAVPGLVGVIGKGDFEKPSLGAQCVPGSGGDAVQSAGIDTLAMFGEFIVDDSFVIR